ncbi:ABC transporter ATP-binding protein [candidate division WWE3 bacterium]|uniref:ABC transporter ATP-binding protein n=1 Tax=candidate division WWE3 bacterium TaxID=2053526 RepID=A0A928Y5T0_UNCKA|nr:ABC transporter ATP-binding protein [candidate division WWE3 bacterium]
MKEALIKVKHLVKNYQSGHIVTKVLKNLTFDVHEGEFLSVIGPSGSGKSTLLYQLSLLDRPTSGSIHYGKICVTELGSKERTALRLNYLGYVFQEYALLPDLTAIENVMVPNIMRGFGKAAAKEMAKAALEKLNVGHRLDNLPGQLSGGEQQRVSIARAIAHTPAILFADEPTANLDTENSDQVMDAFLDLHYHGQTIVMVNHEQEYAKIGDRIMHLLDGSIEAFEISHHKKR